MKQPKEGAEDQAQLVNDTAKNQANCGNEQCEQAKRVQRILKSLRSPTYK